MSDAPIPLIKLIDLVSDELKSGSSREAVINKLVQSGLDAGEASHFVDTIITTRRSHFSYVAKYFIAAIMIFFIYFSVLLTIFSKEELTDSTKYVFIAFISLIIIFGVSASIGGKISTYIRYGISHIFWLTTATLSGLLFIQESWSEPAHRLGGGAIAALIKLAIGIAVFLGPFWLGAIFCVLSLLLVLVAWSTWDDIKNGNFEVDK